MITEAVDWLRTYGGSALSDGVLDSSDYKNGKFITALSAADGKKFWTTSQDVDGTSADIHATGEDLKNVLMAFNSNKLITSSDFNNDGFADYVGWNQNTTDPEHVVSAVDVRPNGPDAFWDVVHDHINNFGGLTWHG